VFRYTTLDTPNHNSYTFLHVGLCIAIILFHLFPCDWHCINKVSP